MLDSIVFTVLVIFIIILFFGVPLFLILGSVNHEVRKKEDATINKYQDMINQIRKNDLYFDEMLFKENASRCVLEVFDCIYKGDVERLRLLESTDLYAIHCMDIETGLISGYMVSLDIDPNIKLNIDRYYIDGRKEVILCSAYLISKEKIFDPKTKKILNEKPAKVFHDLKLEFSRHYGVKTTHGHEFAVKECPNCGASIKVNEQGKCEYCDSIIVNGEHSWVLSKISDFYTN